MKPFRAGQDIICNAANTTAKGIPQYFDYERTARWARECSQWRIEAVSVRMNYF